MDAAAPTTPAPEPEKPQGRLNAILATLPVALAALATAFAGMSSSEMTQAMYHRSLAAQHQSKAGDQWAFFQSKRTRGTSFEMTAELLRDLGDPVPFNLDEIDSITIQLLAEIKAKEDAATVAKLKYAQQKLAALLGDPAVRSHLQHLTVWGLQYSDILIDDPIKEVLVEIRHHKTEAETASQVRKIKPDTIEQATQRAEQAVDKFDQESEPATNAIQTVRLIMSEVQAAVASLRLQMPAGKIDTQVHALDARIKGFRLAALEFDARRYRHEASLNHAAAELYELRVRRSAVESDRHRERSEMFFYSMLLAQMGVTVASLALAQRTRKSLWFFAAFAGMISLCFSGYIYLTY